VGIVCHYRLTRGIDAHKPVALELHDFAQLLGNSGLANSLINAVGVSSPSPLGRPLAPSG